MTMPVEAVSPPTAACAQAIETHSAVLLLYGDTVLKIKKPVYLGFLDFRSADSRARACEREVQLNRRLAADVYLDAVRISGPGGRVHDHGVLMRRMPADRCLRTLVRAGTDVSGELRTLARLMARFHAACTRSDEIATEAGLPGLRRRWCDNLDETVRFRDSPLDARVHDDVRRLALQYVDGRGPLFSARAAAGRMVDGHGDLIAADVYCLADGPRVLDCIEFDDRLRFLDVLDDVAFLAMDLEYLGRPDLGQGFLDAYAEFSGAPTVASLAHHYVAYRAFVRAKVACLRCEQGVTTAAAEARRHAELARAHLRAGEVTLCLVGGAPGTGKTTLAGRIADRLGDVLISSDVVRQELGFARDVRYGDRAKNAVYAEMISRARRLLSCGESVVLDATWSLAEQRRRAATAAAITSSRMVEIECQAPVEVAAERAERRRRLGAAASEAGGAVSRLLAVERDPWPGAAVIDTTQDDPTSLIAALNAFGSTR